MHSINHGDYVKAASQRKPSSRAVRPSHERPHGPPGRLRPFVARGLAAMATRIDRETARRVVA